jgi:hypothetical protein
LPVGTSLTRPDSPVYGTFRYNTSIGRLEYYNGTVFKTVSITGEADIVVDTFTGDGLTVTFGPMSALPSAADQVLVFVGAVYQNPSTYTINNYDITFTSAPPTSEIANIIHNIGSTAAV